MAIARDILTHEAACETPTMPSPRVGTLQVFGVMLIAAGLALLVQGGLLGAICIPLGLAAAIWGR